MHIVNLFRITWRIQKVISSFKNDWNSWKDFYKKKLEFNGRSATLDIYPPTTGKIKDFVRLRPSAPDCEFQHPNCHWPPIYKYQRSVYSRLTNESIHTDISAKANQLKALEDVIEHSEAFDTAQHDQMQLQGSSEMIAARICQIIKRREKNQTRQNYKPLVPAVVVGAIRTTNKYLMTYIQNAPLPPPLPPEGKNCLNCKIPNRFAHWSMSTTKSKWLCPSSHCRCWIWSGFRHVHNNYISYINWRNSCSSISIPPSTPAY